MKKNEKYIPDHVKKEFFSPLVFDFYIKGCIEDIINLEVGCKLGLNKLNTYTIHDLLRLYDIQMTLFLELYH